MMKSSIIVFLFLCSSELSQVYAQNNLQINPDLINTKWSAQWIGHPEDKGNEYGVFHFRNSFDISSNPDSFIVHVSAHNRYRLFVNGKPVGMGPQSGDKLHWMYDTYDLAPFLSLGKNTIAAMIFNKGEHGPIMQISLHTGFLLQGNTEKEAIVDTNTQNWKVIENEAYRPYQVTREMYTNTYYALGACDSLYADRYPWGWESTNFDDQSWVKPKEIYSSGYPFGYGEGDGNLLPRNIPMLEEKQERLTGVVRATGVKVDANFLSGTKELIVPKNASATILLDLSYLTTAYPELIVSEGKGSVIDISYAEALFDENLKKGNRNETENKKLIGYHDAFLPDGGRNRIFRPLWYRTYRFIELNIQTAEEPLIINDFYGVFTAYPFEEKASFSSKDPELKRIWDVSWKTARLCAHDTYYDCPYYEQLQYIGDTRIQALVSLHVAGDDRLMRNALELFNYSRIPEGITQSRYPTDLPQMIPPFSLYWIDMVHDFFMFRNEPEYLKQFLPGINGVVSWFEDHLNEKFLVCNLKWWNFVDWAPEFEKGVPKGAEEDEGSAIISLQFVYALDRAAELSSNLGRQAEGEDYRALADKIRKGVFEECYDPRKKLFADTHHKDQFSQHVNVMAILTDVIPENQQADLMQRILTDKSLIQCTIYYKFYLLNALKKSGLGDLYLDNLDSWEKMLSQGLTTFAETDNDPRSDCHAWSASPMIEFLATVCGIEPAEPGFKKVKIEPHLGDLKEVSGKMPHPLGEIHVDFKRKGKSGIIAEITLPEGLTGEFLWNNETTTLQSGNQLLKK